MITEALEKITDESLRQYATELLGAGFTVYVSPRPGFGTYFLYSRVLDGRTLWGSVQLGDLPLLGQPPEHHMPIKTSREHGSSMFVESPALKDLDPLTVEYARIVASPTNRNHIVGRHENWQDVAYVERTYIVIRPTE